MNDNSMDWNFGIALVGAIIVIIGFITSRNLPEIQKKHRIRKFSAVALAFIFFGFSLFAPIVPSYSNARYFDRKVEKLNSIEEAAEFNKEQARIVSDLAQDIKDLRADLYSVNRFYENTTRILLFTVAILAVTFAFTKKEEAKQ